MKYEECGVAINKSIIVLLAALSITALCTSLVPNVMGSPSDIKILSYSWYISPSTSYNAGDLIVVGEVQNTGPNVLDYVTLGGIAYTTDGQAQGYAYSVAYVDHILPQQKAAFYMDFSSQTSLSGNLSWVFQGIDHIEFSVTRANETDSQQYQDLAVVANTSYVDTSGIYTVVGYIQNTGAQLTGKVWVVATFYNASGTAIAAGYCNYLADSLSPNGTIQFAVSPLDSTAQLATQISSYALLIQNQEPTANPSPTPSSQSPNPSPTLSPSTSEQPTQSPEPKLGSLPTELVFAIVGVVLIVVILIVAFILRRKQKPKSSSI